MDPWEIKSSLPHKMLKESIPKRQGFLIMKISKKSKIKLITSLEVIKMSTDFRLLKRTITETMVTKPLMMILQPWSKGWHHLSWVYSINKRKALPLRRRKSIHWRWPQVKEIYSTSLRLSRMAKINLQALCQPKNHLETRFKIQFNPRKCFLTSKQLEKFTLTKSLNLKA